MTVTFDTSAWIEYFLGSEIGQLSRSYVDGDEPIITSAISIMEIKDKYLREGKRWQDRISLISERSEIIVVDDKLAILAADMKRDHHLHSMDALIYATSQAVKSKLLTKDAHFKDLKDVIILA